MERWSKNSHKRVEAPEVDAFIEEVLAVCRKHNISIGHEDEHGAFVIRTHYEESWAEWLRHAHLD